MAMRTTLTCWRCGKLWPMPPLPMGRAEQCPQCTASLRACRQCRLYDTAVSKDCGEPMAEEVSDKEAANYCDYFQPGEPRIRSEDAGAGAARERLNALFGSSAATPSLENLQSVLEQQPNDPTDEQAEARKKLERLFDKAED